MSKKQCFWREYGTYVIAYGCSYLFSVKSFPVLSGCLLIAEALWLYYLQYRKTDNFVDLAGLFTLSWVGGQGIACLQLSYLQRDWHIRTWACFFLIYLAFRLGYTWMKFPQKQGEEKLQKSEQKSKRLLVCIVGLAIISVICFWVEVIIVGFVPILSKEPHAYSYFHVSGVHYFTISCILIPAMSVIYLRIRQAATKAANVILAAANVVAVSIPVICVSRFQLLFAVGFAVVTYIAVYHNIRFRTVIILLVIMIPAYVVLTVFRNHDVAYLNSIFEPRYGLPIFITQPYMYIANNFENFNCMVEQLTEHTYGLKMLFPVFALSGLKFLYPQLVTFPVFLTKPELTTLTMFYDAYYDFGIIGTAVFALIVGILARFLTNCIDGNRNPVIYLFYGQMAIYLGLSFFTTWFSNPTTWFWLILTGMMYLYVGYDKKGKQG